MRRSALRNICIGMLVCAGMMAAPAHAIFGIGLQYGMDFSLSMPDKIGAQIPFDNLKLNTTGFGGTVPASLSNAIFQSADLPIYIDRSSLERTAMNLGGKIYVDVIPFIDAVEVAGNFGVWQYNGKIRYPKSITVNPNYDPSVTSLLEMQKQNMVAVQYDTMDLSLKKTGVSFLGLSETPYAKLQMELNIRKYLKLPIVGKVIKPYAGVGANVNFTTPALSTGLVNEALGNLFNSATPADIANLDVALANSDNQKKIVEEILKRLFTPHYGAQILAGLMIKIPVIPIGLFVDGKYMIPFGAYDKDADITGNGFLVNVGIALAF